MIRYSKTALRKSGSKKPAAGLARFKEASTTHVEAALLIGEGSNKETDKQQSAIKADLDRS